MYNVRVLMNKYLAPGLQCISNNIAEKRNLPHSHIRLQNMMPLESNVNIIAGTPHGAVQVTYKMFDHFKQIRYRGEGSRPSEISGGRHGSVVVGL